MAALAATGLTCCGGGGGSDAFAYKTIEITSPTSNVGEMYIRVTDPVPEASGMYVAYYGFGVDNDAHKGKFRVKSQDEKEANIVYYISNYDQMVNDENAVGFYGSIISGAERDDDGNLADVDFPFMELTLTYAEDSKTYGDCAFICTFPVDDEATDEEKEELDPDGDGYYTKPVPGGATFVIKEH